MKSAVATPDTPVCDAGRSGADTVLTEAQLAQLYHDLQARSADEDAIQGAVLRTLQRIPPPRDPVMYARGVLWRLTGRQIRTRKRYQGLKGAWRQEAVRVTPAHALARAEARETLAALDRRLILHTLGVVRVSKRMKQHLMLKGLRSLGGD